MFFNTSTYFANETWESKDSEREPLLPGSCQVDGCLSQEMTMGMDDG